jgi:hypothetical protein
MVELFLNLGGLLLNTSVLSALDKLMLLEDVVVRIRPCCAGMMLSATFW